MKTIKQDKRNTIYQPQNVDSMFAGHLDISKGCHKQFVLEVAYLFKVNLASAYRIVRNSPRCYDTIPNRMAIRNLIESFKKQKSK